MSPFVWVLSPDKDRISQFFFQLPTYPLPASITNLFLMVYSPNLQGFEAIKPVRGVDYNKALCGAQVALCFLSKLNRDTYTRRCFEIPATRTLMLAEYTADLASLFREGVDADFFRSTDELIAKLRLYVHNEPLRDAVSAAGYRRVYADGHDVSL